MSDINRNSIINIVSNYAGKFGNRFISSIIALLIIDLLSKTEYGVYTYFTSLLVFFYILSTLGIRSSLRRFVPQFKSKINPIRIYYLLLPYILVLSLFWISVLFLMNKFFPQFVNIVNFEYLFVIFSAVIIFQVQNQILEVIYKSFLLHRIVNFILLSIFVIKLIFIVFFLNEDLSIEKLMFLDVILFFLYYIVTIIFLKRHELSRNNSNFEIKLLKSKQFRNFSFWSFLQESGGSALDISLDILIISVMLNETSIANYGFATKLVGLLFLVIPTFVLHDYINPIIYKAYSDGGSKDYLNKIFILFNKVNLIFALPVSIFIIGFSNFFLNNFFDGKYSDVVLLVNIIAIFQLLNTYQYSLSTIINSLKQVKYFTYVRIFAIYNVVMDIILIRYYGIEGAAIATGSTVALSNIYLFYKAKKFINISLEPSAILKLFIIFLPLISLSICSLYFELNTFLLISAFIITTLISYFYLYSSSFLITKGEREILMTFIK